MPTTSAQTSDTSTVPLLPGSVPLLGHLPGLVGARLAFLQKARTHGPVVEVRLGRLRAVLVNDAELLHDILVTNASAYERGVHFQKARAVAGNGIITSSGAHHRRQRRMVLPAFNHHRIRRYAEVMEAIADETVERWSDSAPIDVRPELIRLATDTASRCLFSKQMGVQATEIVQQSLPVVTKNVSLRVLDPTGLMHRLPLRMNRQFAETMSRLDGLVARLIADYRSEEPDARGDDLLSMLMRATDAETGEHMTDQEIRDETISILLSSAETTALTLSWALYLLATNPGQLRRAQAEVDSVLGARRTPRASDLTSLPHLDRVLKETLRLYPPTYFLSRSTLREVDLGPFRLPADTLVLYSLYAQHRDPQLFCAPDTFDPDRWLDERKDEILPYAYAPFGEGAHRCVGEGFAWTEAMTVLSTILAQREVSLAPGRRVRPVGTVTLAPSSLQVIAARRVRPTGQDGIGNGEAQ